MITRIPESEVTNLSSFSRGSSLSNTETFIRANSFNGGDVRHFNGIKQQYSPLRSSLKRSNTFSEKLRKCACGKPWMENSLDNSRNELNIENHNKDCLSILRARSTSVLYRQHSYYDIEDMIDGLAVTDESILKEIIKSEPVINLSYDKTENSGYCKGCKKSNCLLVKKVSGYYHPEHVARHCKADDCWIHANGVVYDVTRYLSKHPGGARSILKKAGTDASIDFEYHKQKTKNEIWEKYRIGRLSFCDQGKHEESCTIS